MKNIHNIAVHHRKNKSKVSKLAKDTYLAIAPFIDPYGCGEKTNEKNKQGKWVECPRPYIRKYHWKQYRASGGQREVLSFGEFCPEIVQRAMDGKKIYFTGNNGMGIWSHKSLLKIDIDAHETWQDDLLSAVDVIIGFVGVAPFYIERSERGVHLYFIVDWGGTAIAPGIPLVEFRELIKKFQKDLRDYCLSQHVKCGVEVKGKPGTESRYAPGKHGEMARLPVREDWNEAKLAAFKALPIMSVTWLRGLTDSLREATPKMSPETKEIAPKIRATGSCPLFKPQDVEGLLKEVKNRNLGAMAEVFCNRASGRRRIPQSDYEYAIAVMILAKKTLKNQHHKDELPTAWCEAVWTELYECGIFSRAFDSSRWAKIRDTLADLELIELVNADYWFTPGEHSGKAMQWHISDNVYKEVDEEPTESSTSESIRIYAGTVSCPRVQYVEFRWRPTWIPTPRNWIYQDEALDRLDKMYAKVGF